MCVHPNVGPSVCVTVFLGYSRARVCVSPCVCVRLTFILLTPLLTVPGLCVCLFSLLAQELNEEQECVIHPSWGLLEKPAGPGAALHLESQE